VTFSASDVDSFGSTLSATTSFTKDGGTSQSGLPVGLNAHDEQHIVGSTLPGSRDWSVSGNILAAPGPT